MQTTHPTRVVTLPPTDPGPATTAALLRRAAPIVERAELTPAAGGWHAALWLDRRVVGGRAEQQGLRDRSVAAAAAAPAVRRALDAAIERVNRRLAPDERIAGYELVVPQA